MRLWDLEALGMLAAGVFTLNVVCTAIVTSAVALVRSRTAELRKSVPGGAEVSNLVRKVRRTK